MTLLARRLLSVLPGLALAGCTLIDQTTFNPRAAEAPVIPQAPKPAPVAKTAGPPPLVVVGAQSADWQAPLLGAVRAARARKSGVLFDVVEIQPPGAAATESLGQRAGVVARTITGAGVPASQVRLALRPDAAGAPGEVRVYVQ